MSKKSFKKDIVTGADRFFSVHDKEVDQEERKDTQDASGVLNVQDTQGIQDTKESSHMVPYRINLKLDPGLKDFLSDEAWKQRKSITALLNDIISEYRMKQESKS